TRPGRMRRGTLTAPEPEEISPEEFDDLVADLDVGDGSPTPEPPVRTSPITSTGGARPAPKKDKPAKPKRPRNRRHGRSR
nr:hypothetical protein [Actinomycetota bacterium]